MRMPLADKNTQELIKDAVGIEELARLAVVASTITHTAAILISDPALIHSTDKPVLAADEVLRVAASSIIR